MSVLFVNFAPYYVIFLIVKDRECADREMVIMGILFLFLIAICAHLGTYAFILEASKGI